MASSAALAEAWAPTAEQDHNLQLLELVAKLREALLGIPALVLPSAGAAAAAGGDGSQQVCVGGSVRRECMRSSGHTACDQRRAISATTFSS